MERIYLGDMIFPGFAMAVVAWRCITKCDALGWFGLARFCTTVRISHQEQMMFEISSKSSKNWNGRKMI